MALDNVKRYGAAQANPHPSHRRTASQSLQGGDANLGNLEVHNMSNPLQSPPNLEADVFPPLRSRVTDPSSFVPYTSDDHLGLEEDYEDYLLDLPSDGQPGEPPFPGFWAHEGGEELANAWHRVKHLAGGLADDISDSESVVTIGDLGEEEKEDGSTSERDGYGLDQNVNNWEVRYSALHVPSFSLR